MKFELGLVEKCLGQMHWKRQAQIGFLCWLAMLVLAESNADENFKLDLTSRIKKRESTSECNCSWGEWMNNVDYHPLIGDNNSYSNLRRHYVICNNPDEIQCRSKLNPQLPFYIVQRKGVNCDVTNGLVCLSRPINYSDPKPQSPFYCDDYEIRVYCCHCPQTTTTSSIVFNMTSQLDFANSTTTNNLYYGSNAVTTAAIDPIHLVIPVSIIIVIVVAIVIIIGIMLCFLMSHKSRKPPKQQDVYMMEHTYLQRPVSFTDVDRHSVESSSSLETSSSKNSYHGYRLNNLDNGKLMFIQPERHDQPDVIPSTKYSVRHQVPQERQWLPDEYERSKERQLAKSGKKSYFTRSAPSQSPKNTAFLFPESN